MNETTAESGTLQEMEHYYDLRAQEYDHFYTGEGVYTKSERPGWHEDLAELIALIGGLEPVTVIDAACGTGFLTRHLRGTVTAYDQSARMLDVAATRLPEATIEKGDAFHLPYPDKTFDRLFTGHFYGHLRPNERDVFLDEARRVANEIVVVDAALRPNGIMEQIVDRPLLDGTWHKVYKRWFTGAGLAEELGGGTVLHEGPWFVIVRHICD